MAKKRKRPYSHRRRYPNLAAYVLATGEPQMDIAAAVGVTQGEISRILRGLKIPRPAVARKLADHCRIPLDSFVRGYVA